MQYPTYQQAGWPIGSGSVESANKVVVEARLKGAGMRWQRHNVNRMLALRPAAELLFHSDRRSQYTSDTYRAVLAQAGISVSMSRTGNRYDNAVTESFFGTLKGECVERSCFQTRREARQTIFEYVEC